MIQKQINLKKKFGKFSEYWSPKVIAEMNSYQFKLAKVKGEFIWHQHVDTDETFFVIQGKLTIEFRDGKALAPLKVKGKTNKTGTFITSFASLMEGLITVLT